MILVVVVSLFNLIAKKKEQEHEDKTAQFFEKERAANEVRKQSLDNLPYIHVPGELLAACEKALETGDGDMTQIRQGREALSRLQGLRRDEAKIVNLTGQSNTDLKFAYGTANLTALTEYDAHYTLLATSLQELGAALYAIGAYAEAEQALSFAASTGTDITATYRLLIDLYRSKCGLTKEAFAQKLGTLLPVAEDLKSLSRDGIVRMIREALPEEEAAG